MRGELHRQVSGGRVESLEVPGKSHFSAEAQEHDAERDRQMQALGLRIIRVNDGEVRKDPERIASWIIEQAEMK